MKTIFLALIFAFGVSGYEEKAGTIRIDLKRQKTPWEQYLKYSTQFKEFGIHLDRDTNLTNSTVPVYRYLDNEFYGKISLGNPGQCMNVALDTSWSLSWVISSKCGTFTTGCLFHNKYDHDISSSYKKDGRPYSADAFNGFYSYDSISVGQTNVTTFSFVEMVGVPNSLFSNKADGALGLGLKYGDYEPFVYALYRQKKIREPIFSIYLNRVLLIKRKS
ncbi:hypothetical protein JTB14_036208 [Gonioctena quinquepunctata]|nr:hypothetical protein JTB14_036208 [Gonioctena quinquepunctata]